MASGSDRECGPPQPLHLVLRIRSPGPAHAWSPLSSKAANEETSYSEEECGAEGATRVLSEGPPEDSRPAPATPFRDRAIGGDEIERDEDHHAYAR